MNDSHTLPVTAVIVNFRTPDLTIRAADSFRLHYASLPLLVIDNGSGGSSPEDLQKLTAPASPLVDVLFLPKNIHHGPAMDLALKRISSPYVFVLDSDCTVHRHGLLEAMVGLLEGDPLAYAAGKKIFMDRRGYDTRESPHSHPYIRPIAMLIKRDLYLTLPPFRRHGAPCLANMIAAVRDGYSLVHVSVEEYITHEGRGTASRHGYRLGLRGKVNHLLHRLGF